MRELGNELKPKSSHILAYRIIPEASLAWRTVEAGDHSYPETPFPQGAGSPRACTGPRPKPEDMALPLEVVSWEPGPHGDEISDGSVHTVSAPFWN